MALGQDSNDDTADDTATSERASPFDDDLNVERFTKLLSVHDRAIYAYVYALVPNWDDAQEIMQRVRLRLWLQFDRYDEQKPFDAWGRAVAYYLVLAFRKERSRRREYFSPEVMKTLSGTFDESEELATGRREVLLECLRKLGEKQRSLLRVYYGRSKSTAEVASDQGVTPGALRQVVFRVRKLLRECADRSIEIV